MKNHRTLIALMLIIALPYSAAAAMVGSLGCHHEGFGALAEGVVSMHHNHAAMMHAHYAAGQPPGGSDCDCPIKCACAHQCTGSGVAALPNLAAIGPTDSGAQTIWSHRGFISDPSRAPLFRPPIVVLPSAA